MKFADMNIPKWNWYTKIKISKRGITLSKPRVKHTWHWSCFNPIIKIKNFFRNNYYNGIFSKYPYLQCEGCGEGIIEFVITNPNFGMTDKWKVCRGCVDFYDRKWTKRKITLK